MRVVTSLSGAEFVRRHGGRLFVRASGRVCCGGTRFIEASTTTPRDLEGFFPVGAHDGIEIFVRPAAGEFPDELRVDTKGRFHPRVEAHWNGCAFLV